MARSDQVPPTQPDSNAQFPITHWTRILQAGGTTSPEARDALNELCQTYWYPIYAFVRRSGHESHTAKDLTQDFIIHLLETDFLKKADRNVGKFRSFLCASLRNFVEDQRRKEKAVKRGGAVQKVSIDESEAEGKYCKLPHQEPDPVKVYDRAWAATVIEHVKLKLKETYADRGRLAAYEALAPFLAGESNPDKYAELAVGLNMTRENVQVTLSRMRDEFGEFLRKEIAKTVKDPADIGDEIRYLLSAWAARVQSEG